MLNLQAVQTINSNKRNSSIDIFRCLAIISVVVFHFDSTLLPFGALGVDLFFVISGLLIGGILTQKLKAHEPVNFFKFILQRGFKIWPSFYFFLFVANFIIVPYLYKYSHPEEIIPLWDIKRYLFFYQNYTGTPFHWVFDHVWTLCVEEHFYILLPILFIIIQKGVNDKYKVKALFVLVILTIVAGILFKFASFYFTHSKDTNSGTHNRIDALAWGVLLNLIIDQYKSKIQSPQFKISVVIGGILLLIVSIYFSGINEYFKKLIYHSLVPMSFFLMIMGCYFIDFSKLKLMRFIAYYSYNWYLWHPMFTLVTIDKVGNNWMGLLVYILLSFTMAVITTIVVEEYFLKKRGPVLNKLFAPANKIDQASTIA